MNWFCIVYSNVQVYRNIAQTFLEPVAGGTEALLAGVNDDLVRSQLNLFNDQTDVYLWDLGVERADWVNEGDGLIIRLAAGEDKGAHYCYIKHKLVDGGGEIGDFVGWQRFFGGPWSTPMMLTPPCDVSRHAPDYLQDKAEIFTHHGHRASFYKLPHGERILQG